jgi:hypothetical protein
MREGFGVEWVGVEAPRPLSYRAGRSKLWVKVKNREYTPLVRPHRERLGRLGHQRLAEFALLIARH